MVVTSKDFKIHPTINKLSLPRTGASNNLQFTVRPDKFGDRGYIKVELFYRGYLLQSKQLGVLIIPTIDAEIPESLHPAQTSRVTFTTTDLLSNQQLALLPERVLTVDVELDQRDGSIDFRFDHTKAIKNWHFMILPCNLLRWEMQSPEFVNN